MGITPNREGDTMNNLVLELICKEHGIEVMGCLLHELSKIPNFERLNVVNHSYDFLLKEITSEKESLLSDENNKAVYFKLKNKLNALPDKKEPILDMEKIIELLNRE